MSTSVEQVANAVLYEGYILYPYRPSAVKNRQRWNFGLIYPRNSSAGPSTMQTECLVRGTGSTAVKIRVRFLQVFPRRGAELDGFQQEAMERDISVPAFRFAGPAFRHAFSFRPENTPTASLNGVIDVAASEVSPGAYRATVRISNLKELGDPDRADHEALALHSMVSTHTILDVTNGDFVSLLEPPEELRDAAAKCHNVGTWPVLAGEKGECKTMLSSPIILYDYPEIAQESPGELFDGTEIDEILTLRIMTMTDQEKEEMRHSDARARQILERTEALPLEHLAKLHGALRGLHPAAGQ